MSLKGSKTEQNLKDAFAGESQANRRYLYFAAKADVEGFNDVSAVFRSTAEGETGHAHGHLEYLEEIVREEEQNPQDYHASVRCDILFHSKFYEIIANETLERFQSLLRPHMESRQYLFKPERFKNETDVTHRDLLESLKTKDVNDFMQAMNRHINPDI